MSSQTRTFLALPIPSDVVSAVGRMRRRVEPDAPGMRWGEPASLHITLAFLGDVDHADLPGLCRRVVETAGPFRPLSLEVQGLGGFPRPSSVRTLWAGISGEGLDGLNSLQKALSKAMRELSYPPDEKGGYTPHLTLARVRTGRQGARPPDLSRLIEKHANTRIGGFQGREVVAFSSTLTPDGPEYARLARARLVGPNFQAPA